MTLKNNLKYFVAHFSRKPETSFLFFRESLNLSIIYIEKFDAIRAERKGRHYSFVPNFGFYTERPSISRKIYDLNGRYDISV